MSYSVDPVHFSAYHNLDEKKRHEDIIMGQSDNALFRKAYSRATFETQRNANKQMKKDVESIIGADIFINGTAVGSGLGGKAIQTVSRTGMWGGAFALMSGYNKLINKICDHSDSLDKARKEHPFATAMLYLTGGIAMLTGADVLYNRAKNAVANKYPKMASAVEKGIANIEKSLNNNWVNKEIVAPISKLSKAAAKEMPTITKAVKTAAPYAPIGLLGLAFVKNAMSLSNLPERTKEIYNDLKAQRNERLIKSCINQINELDQRTAPAFFVLSGGEGEQEAV